VDSQPEGIYVTADIPRAIVVARRLAGAVLILSLLLVLVGIALLIDWYWTLPGGRV
jgi:hypothetical protein